MIVSVRARWKKTAPLIVKIIEQHFLNMLLWNWLTHGCVIFTSLFKETLASYRTAAWIQLQHKTGQTFPANTLVYLWTVNVQCHETNCYIRCYVNDVVHYICLSQVLCAAWGAAALDTLQKSILRCWAEGEAWLCESSPASFSFRQPGHRLSLSLKNGPRRLKTQSRNYLDLPTLIYI